MAGLREECGVFGAFDFSGQDVASYIYYGLFALQHRGQESAGISVTDTNEEGRNVMFHKDSGLVNEVFNKDASISPATFLIETKFGFWPVFDIMSITSPSFKTTRPEP